MGQQGCPISKKTMTESAAAHKASKAEVATFFGCKESGLAFARYRALSAQKHGAPP
jgi:hypothetical protein